MGYLLGRLRPRLHTEQQLHLEVGALTEAASGASSILEQILELL